MKRNRFFSCLLTMAMLLCMVTPQSESQGVGGKINASASTGALTFLCRASISVAATSIGPCTFPSPPNGMQWRRLVVYDYVSGYGGGGDTAGYRFNGDTGNNYRYECNTMAAGGTTFAAGATAATTNVIKLAPADSTLTRNFEIIINNSSEKTEKTVMVHSLTGTGVVGTQAAFDLCNGAWVSAAATPITSITSVTLTNNMGAQSGFAVFGVAW